MLIHLFYYYYLLFLTYLFQKLHIITCSLLHFSSSSSLRFAIVLPYRQLTVFRHGVPPRGVAASSVCLQPKGKKTIRWSPCSFCKTISHTLKFRPDRFRSVLVSYNKLEDESRHTTFCGCFGTIFFTVVVESALVSNGLCPVHHGLPVNDESEAMALP